MAQKLRDDKIGSLTGGASITMAASSASPAWLTIGGQQYRITTSLAVTTVISSANTRYQVYAVLSGGVPVLVISANQNSVGPAGYTSWKLVASYYTNGSSPVAFGSFVNIEGAPSTGLVPFVPVVRTNIASDVANFSSGPSGFWMRSGGKLYWNAGFATGGGGLTGTAGSLIINGPANLPGSQGGVSDGILGSLAGQFTVENFSPINGGAFYVFSGTDVSLMKATANVMQLSDFNAAGINPLVQIECAAFNSTPIKDL